MNTMKPITWILMLLLSTAVITSCKKDKEEEMTETNNSSTNEEEEDKGTGVVSVIVRMSYCENYVGELTVEVDGEHKGTLSNCNDDLSCGESGAAALNVEVEAGTQHQVEVTSETYSSSNSLSVEKDGCALIEID